MQEIIASGQKPSASPANCEKSSGGMQIPCCLGVATSHNWKSWNTRTKMENQSCCPQPADVMVFYFGGLVFFLDGKERKASVLRKKNGNRNESQTDLL